ncbi:sirohydrochlorin cobaltochelatase [Paucimonas lemoignei]|uniref:Sirohydrochlorin cobaltochelatase n=1 Tax=Paucimonas lemoignei TaxID=29443 RepID=A0A4R3HQ78_PAULE|nr:CbiX/SirB N-terminal domain-containing protein [Paucimonas lemoignei]TCS33981.1 sirohydrochlorin cobaltochelatase [Paucimonas lemoignei]
MTAQALILFGHGARDPRWAAPFERLQLILREQLPQTRVELAFLEFMSPTLPELVRELAGHGCDDITVVPVFFGQGGHVLRDLPPMVDGLRLAHPGIRLKVAAAVGEDDSVLRTIAAYCVTSMQP